MKVEGVNCGSLPPVRHSRDFGLIEPTSFLFVESYMYKVLLTMMSE